MAQRWNIIRLALRAVAWKPTPELDPVGLLTLIFCGLGGIASSLAYEYLAAGQGVNFNPYGLNATLAAFALTLAVSALFVRSEGRLVVLSAMMLLSIVFNLGSAGFVLARNAVALELSKLPVWADYSLNVAVFLLVLIWWGGAVFTILRPLMPTRRSALLRTAGLWLALVAALTALPYQPTFRGRDFDIRSANLWEYISAVVESRRGHATTPSPGFSRAEVELAQPALLETQFSHLAKQVKGKTDIYAIGIAGSSDFNVFPKELDGGLASLGHFLPLEGHVLRLVNNAHTVGSTPFASRQNFAAAVHNVAQVMDRDEDVLVLFMTSHGNEQGLALYLYGAFNVMLAPQDVAAVLDREGIKNRMVIVSACYSGVFVKPLANDNTIVMTAADDKHTSFGCSNEREWTYFGDALFNHGLLPGGDIEEAFRDAKMTIGQWEARDGLEPSNPQASFGRALMAKLAPVYLKPTSKQAMRSAH
jgi:Peptidase C13 family